MTDKPIAIVEAHETLFFGQHDGKLCQWLGVTVENRSGATLGGTVTVSAAGQETTTRLALEPGIREYRAYAPLLWPAHSAVPHAALTVKAGEQGVQGAVSIGKHRPWTVYLLSDVCTDMTWVYGDVESVRADDAETLDTELALAERTRSGPPTDRNHYNLVHAREVEFYLERYPMRAQRLFEHLREGTVAFNPFFDMTLTGDMALEELVRHFYPARNWALEQGLDLSYANHQETPAIAWIMATILAGSGVKYLVKSILPYECPWCKRLEEPPLFAWEGPDGSRVLVRRRNEDYVEGNFVLRDLRMTNSALHDRIIPAYEALGDASPYDAIALVGCYGDLEAKTPQKAAQKTATIAAYNAQPWEYPKLVNASHKQYWDHVEANIAARKLPVPVYRGDYGSGWESWPACMAFDFAGWRRAQERSASADRLAAILSRLEPGWYGAFSGELATGWWNLTYLSDHAWNGQNEANLILNARLRREWQTAANRAFDDVISSGLKTLAAHVPTGPTEGLLVFNGLGWPRSALARVAGVAAGQVTDATTGQPVPAQAVEEDGEPVLYIEARDVPAVGYRVYNLAAGGEPPPAAAAWHSSERGLEGPFYAVEVSPVTGGISRLYDKTRGKELVDPGSRYHLNQALYLSDGIEHTPAAASVEIGPCGPVFGQIRVRAALKNTRVTTTITLYTGLDRVDIRNDVEKAPTTEKQEFDFVFPFLVPDRQVRFEAPGAILAPGADQRPGAGQAVTAVRHFVDVFNQQYGVTLSQADSGLVEFGHRTTTEDPLGPDLSNSTVLAMALDSYMDWLEAVRNQGGATQFVFRYSVRGHGGGFDPVSAVRFGAEENNELLALALPAGQRGDLPPGAHAFLEIGPENAILTGFKVAEENGLIVRLWECAGKAAAADLRLSGLGQVAEARQTDLLERDAAPLAVSAGSVELPLPARGLATVRLLTR